MPDYSPELSWFDAIVKVLQDAAVAMHYTDIADAILSSGLKTTPGATPANTVNAIITTNINSRGDRSEFLRTGRGEYILRAQVNDRSGDGGGGFQCCWTNAHVKVSVAGGAATK